MIRPERLTIKAQEALRDAGELARSRGNPVVNDAHLLASASGAGRRRGAAAAAEGRSQSDRRDRGRRAGAGPLSHPVGWRGRAELQPGAADGSSTGPTRKQGSWATSTSPPSTCSWPWPRRRGPLSGTSSPPRTFPPTSCAGRCRMCGARTGSPTSHPRRSIRPWRSTPAT